MNKNRVLNLVILVALALAVVIALQAFLTNSHVSARPNDPVAAVGIGNLRQYESPYLIDSASQSKAAASAGIGELRRFESQRAIGIGDLRRFEAQQGKGQ